MAPVERLAGEASAPAGAFGARVVPRRSIGWKLAAGLAAIALIVGLAWRSRDGASGPAEVVARPPTSVVLVPFTVPPQAAEIAPQVRALEASVLQRLRMLPGLRVERGVAREGATTLAGDVVGTRSQWRLRIRVRNAEKRFERTYPLQLATLGDTAYGMLMDIARLVRPDSATLFASGGADAGESMRSGLRARAGLTQRDHQDALAAFQRALQLDPNNADAWCHFGGMHLTTAYEGIVSKDAAIPPASEAIDRGLHLNPVRRPAWSKRASCCDFVSITPKRQSCIGARSRWSRRCSRRASRWC